MTVTFIPYRWFHIRKKNESWSWGTAFCTFWRELPRRGAPPRDLLEASLARRSSSRLQPSRSSSLPQPLTAWLLRKSAVRSRAEMKFLVYSKLTSKVTAFQESAARLNSSWSSTLSTSRWILLASLFRKVTSWGPISKPRPSSPSCRLRLRKEALSTSETHSTTYFCT